MTMSRDTSREPCPDRIVEDLGGAFGMGCVGGFLWNFIKGARNSPKGERLHGAMYLAKSRGPILGGNFAVWGGTFATFDCSLQYIRQKEDHWNAICSGFLTGGVLAARGGWKSASRNAAIGGVLLAIIEGVAALMPKMFAQTPREQFEQHKQQEEQMRKYAEQQQRAGASSTPGFMNMGGLFGSAPEPAADVIHSSPEVYDVPPSMTFGSGDSAPQENNNNNNNSWW